jgi:hypothetical protein
LKASEGAKVDLSHALKQVDSESIYNHVLRLEGTRHPIDALDSLNNAADYISSEFRKYGLATEEQTFKVPGCNDSFRNIEASTRNKTGSEFLLIAHYDTVENCPGADDNASSVAVLLETAKILARQEVGNVRFIGVTLEELNPVYVLKSRQFARTLGLKDDNNRYTSFRTRNVMKRLSKLRNGFEAQGRSPTEALVAARTELRPQMNEKEVEYVKKLEAMYGGITVTSWPGKTGLLGSSFWVDEAVRARKKITGFLCLDTIGYTSDEEHSQKLSQGVKPEMAMTNRTINLTIGNFLAIIGDVNSGALVQRFVTQSSLPSVDLPCAALQLPLNYQQMASGMRDLLRSDHAPFWRQGIPGLFLTDTADFRYPYYHTPADSIDKIDFNFLAKICKAIVATAASLKAA